MRWIYRASLRARRGWPLRRAGVPARPSLRRRTDDDGNGSRPLSARVRVRQLAAQPLEIGQQFRGQLRQTDSAEQQGPQQFTRPVGERGANCQQCIVLTLYGQERTPTRNGIARGTRKKGAFHVVHSRQRIGVCT